MSNDYEKYERFEKPADTILEWVKNNKWSALIVAGFWLSGYFAGHYLGDVLHWLGQIL